MGVLDYTGDEALILAVIVIFESLVVVASVEDGYTIAKTECLSKRDRVATKSIKYFRNTAAHSYYNKKELKRAAKTIREVHAIQRIFRQFYTDRIVLNKCKLFEDRLSMIFSDTKSSVNSNARKIYDSIPPSMLSKYSGSIEEIALQFTAEVLL